MMQRGDLRGSCRRGTDGAIPRLATAGEKLSGEQIFCGRDSGENRLMPVTEEVALSGKNTEGIRRQFLLRVCPLFC